MNTLHKPPTLKDLSRMYFELAQIGARALGKKEKWSYNPETKEELIVLASQLSRYDPRLFSITVEYLFVHWEELNPFLLRKHLLQTKTPQALCVMLSFIVSAENKEFQNYYEYISKNIKPASFELFFMNIYKTAGTIMSKASEESLWEFYQWGFLGRERPILHSLNRKTLGHWGPLSRKNIIRNLANNKTSFSIAEYLTVLEFSITRQQALLDLKNSRHVRMKGLGRNARWIKTNYKTKP